MVKIYYPKDKDMSPIVDFEYENLTLNLKPGGTAKVEGCYVQHVLTVFPFLENRGEAKEASVEEKAEVEVEEVEDAPVEEVEEKGKKRINLFK